MKKVVLAGLLLFSICAVSCKKSYNCTCYDANGNTMSSTIISASTLTDAQTNCVNRGTDCSVQ